MFNAELLEGGCDFRKQNLGYVVYTVYGANSYSQMTSNLVHYIQSGEIMMF